MLSETILEAFYDPKTPESVWHDRPATVGNLIRAAIAAGALKSVFGPTSQGIGSLWTETLILTESGRKMLDGNEAV